MADIDRETALRFLRQIRDKIYEDLLRLQMIDRSIPKEHYSPENLWEIAREQLEK